METWVFRRKLTPLLAVAFIAFGCASPIPTASAPTPPNASAAPTAIPTATTTPTLTSHPVDLDVSQSPVFAGDRVGLTVTGMLALGPTSLFISGATVDFGDGTSGTATGSCTTKAQVDHAYQKGGDFEPKVTAVAVCDPTTVADLSGTSARVHVFPAAPAASANWPVCTTFQLRLAGPWSGAGLGNVAVRITLRNVSAHGCTLQGYPDLMLVGRNGTLLPTHVRRATTGAYMFPGIVPHTVALAPGGVASFMIGYGDNPSGPAVNEPYEVACPPSIAVRVVLPGTTQFGTAKVPMGVCGGVVDVSPIVPGAAGLQFS
jgi:hypothetical protein